MRGCPGTLSPGLLTTQAKQHEASIVERPGGRVNQAWVDRLACAAALSYTLPAMHPDGADNERWKPELLSFAQVRAELLAVVMANHPEFTLEEAERMLREAGF
jgi:hypothetical protein